MTVVFYVPRMCGDIKDLILILLKISILISECVCVWGGGGVGLYEQASDCDVCYNSCTFFFLQKRSQYLVL